MSVCRMPGIAGAIDRYNEMVAERKRLLRTSTESNPAIVNLTTSIRAMRSNIQTTLDATLKGLEITKADLIREASRYSRRISDAPTQESSVCEYCPVSKKSSPVCI